jgi:hypothetical protein
LCPCWLIWKSAVLKIGIVGLMSISFILIGAGGAALAVTGINEAIQNRVIESQAEFQVISWFYKQRVRNNLNHPNFHMGRILITQDNHTQLLAPTGKRTPITLPEKTGLKEGGYVRLLGKPGPEGFEVKQYQQAQSSMTEQYFCYMNSKPGNQRMMELMHR